MVRRTMVLLALAFGGAGCFAVHDLDSPYPIDDFDNGSYQPADPNFQPWGCYLVNALPNDPNNQYKCALGAGDQSQYALALDFQLDDPPDGITQDIGAGLQTKARSPEDFTGLKHLAFDVMLSSGNPPLPATAKFYVYLGCSSATADDGSVPGNLAVVYSETAGVYWRTWSINLSDFSSPSWSSIHIEGGTEACLKRVDSIQFEIDAGLSDGTMGAGTLSVDDIYFE